MRDEPTHCTLCGRPLYRVDVPRSLGTTNGLRKPPRGQLRCTRLRWYRWWNFWIIGMFHDVWQESSFMGRPSWRLTEWR